MATYEENCRLCHESLPPKHRRTIFTETFKVFAQLTEVLGRTGNSTTVLIGW
jgi:hypothetical protein